MRFEVATGFPQGVPEVRVVLRILTRGAFVLVVIVPGVTHVSPVAQQAGFVISRFIESRVRAETEHRIPATWTGEAWFRIVWCARFPHRKNLPTLRVQVEPGPSALERGIRIVVRPIGRENSESVPVHAENLPIRSSKRHPISLLSEDFRVDMVCAFPPRAEQPDPLPGTQLFPYFPPERWQFDLPFDVGQERFDLRNADPYLFGPVRPGILARQGGGLGIGDGVVEEIDPVIQGRDFPVKGSRYRIAKPGSKGVLVVTGGDPVSAG